MLDQREEETTTENEGEETSPFPCDLISYISVSSSDRFLSKKMKHCHVADRTGQPMSAPKSTSFRRAISRTSHQLIRVESCPISYDGFE